MQRLARGKDRVLHTLRKLAREVHRRSVWQVVAGYLLFWLLAFEVVEWFTVLVGLPLWTPGMAFVLLGIGLPIVVATAVVQEGLPGLRIVDEVDPNELEGLTPDQVHVVPEEHPLHGARLLTWRNAVLGGVMAGALLVTSVVAYLAMWAFGIGPVGSLAAQGILSMGDTVVVADFTNRTDDPALGSRARELLEVELARSSLVSVLRRGTSGAGTSPEDLTGAMELAGREGVKLVVDGVVRAASDGGYEIEARLLLPDGTVVGGFDRAAEDPDELVETISRLSRELRQRFGESLRRIYEDGVTEVDDRGAATA